MKVLHLDRSTFFQDVMRDIVERYDLEYLPAREIDEAFDLIEHEGVDLVVTAVELGSESADDFLAMLNDSSKNNIPVLVITGADSPELREHYFHLGVVDYILKKEISFEMFGKYIDSLSFNRSLGKRLSDLHIAVLDDSEVSLKIIKKLFDFNGLSNVDYYTSPGQFLGSDTLYQLLLVDVVLPEISGEELILEYRKRCSRCVIIAVSSIDNIKTVSNILAAGANDYLMKPFDSTLFMARIRANVRTFLLMEELEEKRKTLETMAITDGLTELYNHTYVHRILEQNVQRAREYGMFLSIAMLDIDYFKSINDEYGHQEGDAVLRDLSYIIKQNLRDADYVGRYGGEEFLIIFTGAMADKALYVVERIREIVEAHSFGNGDLRITVSGGVAELSDSLSSMELVNLADERLYTAKESGRNMTVAS